MLKYQNSFIVRVHCCCYYRSVITPDDAESGLNNSEHGRRDTALICFFLGPSQTSLLRYTSLGCPTQGLSSCLGCWSCSPCPP